RHIALVTRAEEFLLAQPHRATVASRATGEGAVVIAPRLRGALSKKSPVILEFDDSNEVLAFLSRSHERLGAATPDHLLHTKRFPLIITGDIESALRDYVQQY